MLLLHWLGFFAAALVFWAVLTAAGHLVLWALDIAPTWRFLLGAPVGLATVGVSTFVAGFLRIEWHLWVPVTVTTLIAALAFALRRLAKWRPPGAGSGVPAWRAVGWASAGTVLFAAVQFGIVMVYMRTPDAVPDMGDSQFHLAASELVSLVRDVNPFSGLGLMFEPLGATATHYYPTFWHAIVGLLTPCLGLAFSQNLLVFVVGFVMWPMGLATLVLVLQPSRAWLGFVAPALALAVLAFPANNLLYISLGPYSLGIILVLAVLAVVILSDFSASWLFPSVLIVVAAFAAHPSSGVLAAAPLVVLGLVVGARRLLRMKSRVAAAFTAAGVVVGLVAVTALLMGTEFYQIQARYVRIPETLWSGFLALFAKGVFDAPISIPWILASLLAVYGVWGSRRSRAAVLLLLSSVPFFVLYVASLMPEGPVRAITGIWWKDYTRLIVPPLIVVLVFASLGVAAIACRLSVRRGAGPAFTRNVAVALPMVLGLVGMVAEKPPRGVTLARYSALTYSLESWVISPLDSHTVELLESLDAYFGPDDFVIGPHASGVGFAPLYSELQSFMPMPKPYTSAQRYLEQHFKEIGEDPHVCEIVDEWGIVAFLEQEAPGPDTEALQPGLYGVDTSEGFELLAQSGPVSLYRITACD